MFSGIVEGLGTLKKVEKQNENLHFFIESPFTAELKIDQSVAHNGACLTVVEISEDFYKVTAIKETVSKTNLGNLRAGDKINLERCMRLNDRLDGHIVQGHVDSVGKCVMVEDQNGSWLLTFEFPIEKKNLIVDKGSVCVNGVSLTVVNPGLTHFSVAIIPYTFEHTNFHGIKPGTLVNLEFDIIGKYLARHMENIKI